jgi:hypothetical protein
MKGRGRPFSRQRRDQDESVTNEEVGLTKLKYLSLIFLLPLVVGVETGKKDSSETNIKLAGGAGSYAYISRGCGGQVLEKHKIPFEDFGFSFDHKFKFPVRVGLRGGNIWEKGRHSLDEGNSVSKRITNFYVNPDIALEWRYFGIGGGFFSAMKDLCWGSGYVGYEGRPSTMRNSPSGHLRLGSPTLYFSIHMMESVPLYSGGGYLDLGLGGKAGRRVSYWLGLGTPGPFDTGGFLLKTNIKLKGNWHLDLAGRLGESEGISENAVSFGLNYRFITK